MRVIFKIIVFIIIVFSIGLFFMVKIENKLIAKKESLDNQWRKITKLNDYKISLLKNNILDLKKNDTLLFLLNSNVKKSKCNDDYSLFAFYLNEYILKNEFKKDLNINLTKNDSLINQTITKYNSEVMEFNKYASSFPIIIISRTMKYKTYNKLPIIFGEENLNPKVSKEETFKWLKEIEKSEGL